MNTAAVVDVHELIAERPLGWLQKLVLVLGFCIIAFEGFDMAVMGFIVPVLKQQWHVSSQMLGPALSGAQIGLIVGAMVAGPLADRFGRKVVLVASVALFGASTLLTATAASLPALVVFRVLTGLGVGSVVPNTATLISEYAPERIRSLSVSFIICAVSFSSACAGFMSAWIIPAYGWRSLLVVGGALPLLLLPVLMMQLPESVSFLIARKARSAKIRPIVERMVPGSTTTQSVFVSSVERAGPAETKLLFSSKYLFGGAMLWLTYFAALLASNTLSNWLPTLIKESGFPFRFAAEITGLYQTGGVIGALVIGWGMDKPGLRKLPALACLAGSALFVGIGLVFHSSALMMCLAFALGFFLIGAICSVNALPTIFYPTRARATGSCWMHGAGRCGALLSVFMGAQMLEMHWSADQVFTVLALPALVAAIALFAKDVRRA
ncbi:MFS transporter [Paraburkholderia dipogonis]|uniref:MFS transporter n=1 Tax=Paraburkholderia dipogonis TaxID=1211383 RepID=A0A4Y8MIW5_9BURK|nr:aromatic acid/H+ symport family MFS transporter [Paraburkholderia dipogonis]TFE37313.1 MFS transporter [Paraburkholderia dipogonis]